MRRIPEKAGKIRLPDMSILERYEVHPHAFGFCPKCNVVFDYWREGDSDYMCSYGCGTQLKPLNVVDLAMALEDSEEYDGFKEKFFYDTPLRPVRKNKKKNA